ncbi:MAG: ankyrin repeat domain-containing protein [Verrucomicrobiota bacterium]
MAAAGADVKGTPDQLPLAEACAFGSREAALALLEAGAPVDSDSSWKTSDTPLIAACSSGDPALIEMLLKKGANPDRANPLGYTPLLATARTGGPAAVQALRGKARFPKDPNQDVGLLGAACTGGNLPVAKEMLAIIPDEMRSNIPWPVPLELALLCGHEDVVDWLLKTGGPGLASKGVELQPLLAAILPLRIEKSDAIRERLVAKLLAAGADPNAKSPFGFTPLVMVANGASTADEDTLAVVSLLLKHGAKPEAEDNTKPGLLFGAIAMRRSTLIKPLVGTGAQVNKEMYHKVMPLALAAAISRVATVQVLLDLGADPKVLDVNGISPLAHAAAAGKTASMAVLLTHGAAPDATGPNEKPPVWVAASGGQLRAVRALLVSGANPDAPNPQTKTTALDVAKARGDQAMVTLLEKYPRDK